MGRIESPEVTMIRRLIGAVFSLLSLVLFVGLLLGLIWSASLMGLVDTSGVDSPVIEDVVEPPQWFIDSPFVWEVPAESQGGEPPEVDPNASPPEGDPGTTSAGDVTSDEVEAEIHTQVNEIRAEHGLSQLEHDDEIAAIARTHSQDMNEREYFSHTNPEGESPADRFGNLYPSECRAVGENLAYIQTGFGSGGSAEEIAERIVQGWMDSEGHRENILREGWDTEGIGVYMADGRIDATQNFCTTT
ncbi:cysteine-rich secretory protein family protein [Halalkalicoccus paucihalophilus]|uniref:Cysteine-rich secretory protein family protein n=1 Tax=Halalkalicoccus paucihalophilus TaxID=1008153 RepID=A0A151AGE2_9EURY|nr:CAP domain-containing protein [Halalkalicoccus paucihalophilus]KYH26726.1 cysteine-rich secretory protein family protein [Halalkalicoccus paucihalophilus]